MKKAIIVSGYFNPLHKGHLELFKMAKEIGNMLIVIVNSDLQRFFEPLRCHSRDPRSTLSPWVNMAATHPPP